MGCRSAASVRGGRQAPCRIGSSRDRNAVRVRSFSLSSQRRKTMLLKIVARALAGALAAVACALAFAQAPVEISFYYPVAVGGPITKLVDGFAADFEKEKPRI